MKVGRNALRLATALALLGVTLRVATASSQVHVPDAPLQDKGNGWIAFASDRTGNDEVFRMDFDGGNQINLTDHPASDSQPAWSPKGDKIAFTTDRAGNDEIYLMNADGTGISRLTTDPASDSQPAWSPKGDVIAFTTARDGNDEIYLMNTDGTGVTRLTTNPRSDSQPTWSPDGRQIAFTSNRDGNKEIYAMRSDGSLTRNLTKNRSSDTDPAWSPKGDQIAFSTNRTRNAEIFLMDADGRNPANLTNHPASDIEPVFAPEEAYRLSFTSDRDGDTEVYVTWPSSVGQVQFNLAHSPGSADHAPDWQALVATPPSGSPIEHVVVMFLENQSFDSVLGRLCLEDDSCDGASRGQRSDGTWMDLKDGNPIVPPVGHSWFAQNDAINGGQMNGFDLIQNCTAAEDYACYQQYDPEQVPSLAALARAFVISDRTFETQAAGSWGAHFQLASTHMDGFYQGGHTNAGPPDGPGSGCDAFQDGPWAATWVEYFEDHYPEPPDTKYPTCVPQRDGSGPYKPSAVPWTPTIMDRMDAAGLPWKIYAPLVDDGSYGWAICPTFAGCLYTDQTNNHVVNDQFVRDARDGVLPSLSFVIPDFPDSQHNGASMLQGDNWISTQVDAVMQGADWDSTAIFITYDDCGCFYDHVPPPPYAGIRVPMVIVSPYARPGFTDSNVALFSSMLAFTEHTFGLAPLSTLDATAYDYSEAFDYSQAPRPPIPLDLKPLPKWERLRLKLNPPPSPADDPT
ncbi:hypothetical protein BH20ACT24_BH20ACT24_01620 [soil metagenome]